MHFVFFYQSTHKQKCKIQDQETEGSVKMSVKIIHFVLFRWYNELPNWEIHKILSGLAFIESWLKSTVLLDGNSSPSFNFTILWFLCVYDSYSGRTINHVVCAACHKIKHVSIKTARNLGNLPHTYGTKNGQYLLQT